MEKGGPALIPATNQAADAITSVYADFTFPLNQYTATFNAAGNGITLTIPAPPPYRLYLPSSMVGEEFKWGI